MKLLHEPVRRKRVIVNTDAKNECDDQYAIVHALLTPTFEIHGLIAAHYGQHPGKLPEGMKASFEEIHTLLKLMSLQGRFRVEPGAEAAIPDDQTPVPSAGAQLIIDEAMRDDPRPLNVLFYGPLTDMASALLMEPRINDRNVHVIWIGGTWNGLHGGAEFNLGNDIHAANVVMRSRVAVSQVPYPLYTHFCVSHAELFERVAPHGEIGAYLVEQVLAFNAVEDGREYRSLGDSPAVGVLMSPNSGKWSWQPAPEYDPATGDPRQSGRHRAIRVYETYDARFLLEDFYAKLAQFARGEHELASRS